MNTGTRINKIRPTVVVGVLAVLALLICLLLGGYLYLPTLASRYLPVESIGRLGFTDFTGRVTRIGPYQAAAGPFRFGATDTPAIVVRSVVADYTPSGLRRKRIERLRIDDLTVHASLGPDGIVLPGVDLRRPGKRAPSEPGSMAASLDGAIGNIEIRSARVMLHWRGARYTIPFEVDIRPQEGQPTQLSAQVRLLPADQRLSLDAHLDLASNTGECVLEGAAIHLDRLAHPVSMLTGVDLSGTLGFKATANLQIDPLAVSNVHFQALWRDGQATLDAFRVVPGAADGTARVAAASADLAHWQIDVQGLQCRVPQPVTMETLAASIDLSADDRSVSGQAGLVVRPFRIRCPRAVSLEEDLRLSLAFDFRGNPAGEWTAAGRTIPTPPPGSSPRLRLTGENLRLLSGEPRIRWDAHATGRRIQTRWHVEMQPVQLEASGWKATLPHLQADGQMQFDAPAAAASWQGDVRLRTPEVTVAGRGLTGSLKELAASIDLRSQETRPVHAQGRLSLTDGRITHGPSGFDLSNIRLDLPYDSATTNGPDYGSFSAALAHGGRAIGPLQGRVIRKERAVHLRAVHASALFPGMQAILTAQVATAAAAFPEIAARLDVPAYELPAGDDLGRLLPALSGVTLTGTVSAGARASLSASGVHAAGDLAITDGRLEMAQQKLAVEGIDAALHFPELPRLRSGPAQPLRFSRATVGSIEVDGGRFDFQVESPSTLFVEKGHLRWCGGRIDAQSLRLTAGKQAYALSLYCQRLALARILEQLGAVNARGTGTVNGRIPVVYDNGRIQFDDGFLFSTPGETGQIQLTGTEILTQGIPTGTPQFAQVDLAREALKDYTYQWAKLGMTTEGESLVLRLQFDGQPAGPLPFVYQKEIGGFVRVNAGEQGSRFQGIALDVNLRLPLNRLLEYKEIVDMID